MGCQHSEIYQCSKEGTCNCLMETLRACGDQCEMTCCGASMVNIQPKTSDQGKEKHVPVIEKISGGVKVKIGSIPHPMEPDHYIEFIEVRAGDEIHRKYLKPGMAPEAVFLINDVSVTAIEFCNKHGLWIS
jgi:superoxide reductase